MLIWLVWVAVECFAEWELPECDPAEWPPLAKTGAAASDRISPQMSWRMAIADHI